MSDPTPDPVEVLIKRHEGCVLRKYQDSLGFWTIGIGHCIDPRKGCKDLDPELYEPDGSISQATADEVFEEDLLAVRVQLANLLPWTSQLDAVRIAVFCDMGFEMGVSGLAAFTTFLRLVEIGEYEAAAADVLANTKWAKQVPERAAEDAGMIASGEWSTS